MKQNRLLICLGAEFAALLTLVLLTNELPALFSSLLAFPFEQIGACLRALSLRGSLGNGLALALYVGLSLLPLLPAARSWGAQGRKAEAAALVLLSAALFFVLYGMTNPGTLQFAFPAEAEAALPVVKAVMGGAVWSLAVLWAVLRLLRLFRAGAMQQLLAYLRVMLCALCALFTGGIALSCGAALLSGLAGAQRAPDGVLAVLRFLAAALPYALDIAVTCAALQLLEALLSGEEPRVAALAERLSRRCCISLGAVAAASAGLNLLQLLLARYLSDVAVTVEIPVMSLAFVLVTLLAARLIAENRRLQSDNDLFI